MQLFCMFLFNIYGLVLFKAWETLQDIVQYGALWFPEHLHCKAMLLGWLPNFWFMTDCLYLPLHPALIVPPCPVAVSVRQCF